MQMNRWNILFFLVLISRFLWVVCDSILIINISSIKASGAGKMLVDTMIQNEKWDKSSQFSFAAIRFDIKDEYNNVNYKFTSASFQIIEIFSYPALFFSSVRACCAEFSSIISPNLSLFKLYLTFDISSKLRWAWVPNIPTLLCPLHVFTQGIFRCTFFLYVQIKWKKETRDK